MGCRQFDWRQSSLLFLSSLFFVASSRLLRQLLLCVFILILFIVTLIMVCNLTIGLSIGCIESCKELIKFGADLERGILSKVLISWSNDEVDVEERLHLMTLLFENTRYEPTLEDQSNCSHHITLRLKLLLKKQEPKSLEYLSKISFRKNLIAYSNGQSIIQTIKESKIWPQPLLKRIYDI